MPSSDVGRHPPQTAAAVPADVGEGRRRDWGPAHPAVGAHYEAGGVVATTRRASFGSTAKDTSSTSERGSQVVPSGLTMNWPSVAL